jgi:hypothetical protein
MMRFSHVFRAFLAIPIILGSTIASGASFIPGASSGLRYSVQYSATGGKAGDEITCYVSAERRGFRGYGMLLAEIGLPPGAEADRESLEHAEQNPQSGIGRYDVLPDRVVFYLWPQSR